MVSRYGKDVMRRRLSEVQNKRLFLGGELKKIDNSKERIEEIHDEIQEIDTEIECLTEDVRRV